MHDSPDPANATRDWLIAKSSQIILENQLTSTKSISHQLLRLDPLSELHSDFKLNFTWGSYIVF